MNMLVYPKLKNHEKIRISNDHFVYQSISISIILTASEYLNMLLLLYYVPISLPNKAKKGKHQYPACGEINKTMRKQYNNAAFCG